MDVVANPVHTYKNHGFYEVFLTAFDTVSGKMNKVAKTLAVGDTTLIANNCAANFTFYPDIRTHEVIFEDKSLGSYSKVSWDFGHASIVTTLNNYSNSFDTRHLFPQTGYYYVTLTVMDSATSCFDSRSQVVTAINPKSNVIVSIADFNFSYTGDHEITLENISLGDIDHCRWTFGDGTVIEATYPDKRFDKVVKRYGKGGFFAVTLEVWKETRGKGKGSKKTKYVFIPARAKRSVDFGDAGAPSFLYFVQDSLLILKDNSVGSINKWLWDFGDKATLISDHSEQVSHLYADSGYYRVCLSTTATNGQQFTACQEIRIGNSQSSIVTDVDNKPVILQNSPLMLYPNPVSDKLNLVITGSDYQQIQIYNLYGQLVKTMTIHSAGIHEIDVSLLRAGIYLIKAISSSRCGFGKFEKE